jgi:hypothetical protein
VPGTARTAMAVTGTTVLLPRQAMGSSRSSEWSRLVRGCTTSQCCQGASDEKFPFRVGQKGKR